MSDYFGGQHEEVDDFTADENMAYADLICNGFSTMEIECLEDLADAYAQYIAVSGRGIEVTAPFIIETGDEEC